MRSGSHESEDRQGWGGNLFSHTSLPLFCVWRGRRVVVGGVTEYTLGWPGVHAGARVGNR